jgi:hypothetical protein
VKEGRKKLNNEEPYNLYPSPSIIIMIKSRRRRCAGHVARMGRLTRMLLVENLGGKISLG